MGKCKSWFCGLCDSSDKKFEVSTDYLYHTFFYLIRKTQYALKGKSWHRQSNKIYQDFVIHAINSAQENTRLDVYFLYDGNDRDFLDRLSEKDVTVIPAKSSLVNYFKNIPRKYRNTARGAYLRMEVPKVCNQLGLDDEHVLYTDTDVLFLKHPMLEKYQPEYFCASTQTYHDKSLSEKMADMNTGVMWMNVSNMNSSFSDFVKRGREIGFFHIDFDQTLIKVHYDGLWDYLPEKYNWKPYWGRPTDDVEIVHFHGPKPNNMKNILENMFVPKEYQNIIRDGIDKDLLKYYINLYHQYDD